MKRIVMLVPDVETARQITRELLAERVPEKHIHVIAREGTPMEDLHEAGLAERTDLVAALKRGAAVGGATGLLAGLAALAFPGVAVAGGAVLLASTLAGSAVGAWASSLIGVSIPSEELQRYERAVEEGQLLMMIDIPRQRAEELLALIRRLHPEADIKEVEYFPPPIPEMPDD